MKKEQSYKELQRFDNLATAYLRREGYFDETGWTKKEPTKLVSNIKNVLKQAGKLFEEHKEKVEDLSIDHCLVDEKTKAILREANGAYKFEKEELKKFNTAIRELANSKVEIHIRITEGDWDLTDDEKEVFSGIVIPEVSQD